MEYLAMSTILLILWTSVEGHGRLREPLSRSSMWRDIADPAVAPYADIIVYNYADHQLFCGGFQHQQSLEGKCGVCGDPYDGVRENEAGGKYAKGIITRQYQPGSWIDVQIEITAHHKGYFEFRLYPWNNPTVPITKECLDQYLLENDTPASPKWQLPSASSTTAWYYHINVSLPQGIECDQCVLQWKYHTGNSWGCDNGTCGLGYGSQEEFYGCADVAIGTGATLAPPNTVSTIQSTTTTAASNAVTISTGKQTTSTTTSSSGTNSCANEASGYKYMNDCYSYYMCSNNQAYLFDCPSGTVYNEATSICDYPYNVPSCDSTIQPTTTTVASNVVTTSTGTQPTPTTTSTSGTNSCANGASGYYMNDCDSFYLCSNNQAYSFDCPSGTVYNEALSICDHAYNVPPPCGTATGNKK